jgi:hypothetical protein
LDRKDGPVKKTLLAVMAFGVFVLTASPAAAQYPQAADITISDAAINCPSGETVTITGEGFIPNEPAVRIFFDGEQVAEVFPDDQGNISVTIDPPGAAVGEHTITARQNVSPEEPGQIVATATLICVAAGGVAFTGFNISLWLILLAGLIVIGAVALAVGRRRARAAA